VNPIGRGSLFDCGEGISMRLELMLFSYEVYTKIPMGYDPMNQTAPAGKIPIGFQSYTNPTNQRST